MGVLVCVEVLVETVVWGGRGGPGGPLGALGEQELSGVRRGVGGGVARPRQQVGGTLQAGNVESGGERVAVLPVDVLEGVGALVYETIRRCAPRVA